MRPISGREVMCVSDPEHEDAGTEETTTEADTE
jgi:hypothetical protein